MRWFPSIPLACLLPALACAPASDPNSDPSGSTSEVGDDSSEADSSEADSSEADSSGPSADPPADARALLERLAGLWSAPVESWTSVGSFPRMAMDLRMVDDRVLFGRVDLDADNALRFGFSMQEVDGGPGLVFRNGGLFAGLSRDTATVLVERSDDLARWRFCAMERGCEYVEAILTFAGPDAFELEAFVHGTRHMRWQPSRLGPAMGEVPDPLPANDPDAPWPPMPSLTATLDWAAPTEQPSHAWILIANDSCTLAACPLSRFIRGSVPVGATSIELRLDQMHPGTYRATAVLDRNDDLATTGAPGPGDAVSIPNALVTLDTDDQRAQFRLGIEL